MKDPINTTNATKFTKSVNDVIGRHLSQLYLAFNEEHSFVVDFILDEIGVMKLGGEKKFEQSVTGLLEAHSEFLVPFMTTKEDVLQSLREILPIKFGSHRYIENAAESYGIKDQKMDIVGNSFSAITNEKRRGRLLSEAQQSILRPYFQNSPELGSDDSSHHGLTSSTRTSFGSDEEERIISPREIRAFNLKDHSEEEVAAFQELLARQQEVLIRRTKGKPKDPETTPSVTTRSPKADQGFPQKQAGHGTFK